MSTANTTNIATTDNTNCVITPISDADKYASVVTLPLDNIRFDEFSNSVTSRYIIETQAFNNVSGPALYKCNNCGSVSAVQDKCYACNTDTAKKPNLSFGYFRAINLFRDAA